MKQLMLIIILCTVYLGCKKSHDNTLPPKYPDNDFKATISVDGGSPFVLSATGDATLFVTFVDSSSNRENGFTVLGSNDSSQVEIRFINITAKGTYSFGGSTGPGSVYAFCDYIVGYAFAPIALYSTSLGGSGTVTIDSLSSQYVSGTFSATCVSGNKNTQITSGSFKGNF